MTRGAATAFLVSVLVLPTGCKTAAQEVPYGKGLTDANKERLLIDDMEDVSDWSNGSPEETKISISDKHVKNALHALLFANVVDYTKGEKNYPIGWPRTNRDMVKAKLTDWSAYDFFECWIYADTSRESLPGTPLGLGFAHTGHKRSTDFALKEVKKDEWVKIVIPISKFLDPKDVRSIRFNISESNYKHGDRVDFYISDMALTRYVEPAIAEIVVDRRLLYTGEPHITAEYSVMGYKGMEDLTAEFEVGKGDGAPAASARAKGARKGEVTMPLPQPLTPGTYWARLNLRDANGGFVDRKEVEFRVIAGPF